MFRRIEMSKFVFVAEKPFEIPKNVVLVDDEIGKKMLEVYDKAQEFQPIEIDSGTSVIVDTKLNFCPIKITYFNHLNKSFSIGESRKLRVALEKAENWLLKYRSSNEN